MNIEKLCNYLESWIGVETWNTEHPLDNERFQRIDSDYTKRFEENVKSGMESAQKELAMAIEAGDAAAQVTANKRIAALALENARLEQQKTMKSRK